MSSTKRTEFEFCLFYVSHVDIQAIGKDWESHSENKHAKILNFQC